MMTGLSGNHWKMENFTQRMTTKEWKNVLLREEDIMIFQGNRRVLVAKKLGYGVVEVSKKPLVQDTSD